MEAKKYAIRLVEKYFNEVHKPQTCWKFQDALNGEAPQINLCKKEALICINEIMEMLIEMQFESSSDFIITENKIFFTQVKLEIEQMKSYIPQKTHSQTPTS